MNPPQTLDYCSLPRLREKLWQTVRRTIPFVALAGLVLFIFLRGRTSAEIRLDTGDLRYCFYGIPFEWERMPEPERSKLLAMAAKSTILKPKWYTCATFPLPSTNNSHRMCRNRYHSAVVWAAEDQELARLMLEDVAKYITKTNAVQGLPASVGLLSGFFIEPNANGQWAVKKNWRADEEAVAYMKDKGYISPTTVPSPVETQVSKVRPPAPSGDPEPSTAGWGEWEATRRDELSTWVSQLQASNDITSIDRHTGTVQTTPHADLDSDFIGRLSEYFRLMDGDGSIRLLRADGKEIAVYLFDQDKGLYLVADD